MNRFHSNLRHPAARWLLISVCLISGASTAAERDPGNARDMLEMLARGMISALGDPEARGSAANLQALVERHLVPHIDFEISSALVLGKHWQLASDGEREAFVHEFRAFLIRFYSQALGGYLKARDIPDDIIAFSDEVRVKGDRQAVVSSTVTQPTGTPLPVTYRLFWVDSWKVVDVSLGGISMVKNYQASFSSTVASEGIDGLIAQLRNRNDAFAQPL